MQTWSEAGRAPLRKVALGEGEVVDSGGQRLRVLWASQGWESEEAAPGP